MGKENPKVSVIICSYTTERLGDIRETVQSVLTQTLQPREVIIAVDNNEQLYQSLKTELSPKVKVVLNQGTQGLSETRNVGIRASAGDIIAFIDDDASAEPAWLENLLKPFRSTQQIVAGVSGRAVPFWLNGGRSAWFPEELDWIVGCTYKGLPLQGNHVRNTLGCNMAFRKQVFEAVGFWGDSFGRVGQSGVGEEADICLRLKHKMSEVSILYEPRAIIHHKVPQRRLSFRYVFKRCFDEGSYKSKIQKIHSPLSRDSLSTESAYLRYLLFTSIPEKLKHFYKRGYLRQVGAITLAIIATGVGYLTGRIAGRLPAAHQDAI